jgi:DNA invertase Pin-like site-specific DNA recombinase
MTLMTRTAQPKAACYARISSDRAGDALGVARQIKDGRHICRERGWSPVEYVDNDLTAADPKVTRPAYRAMLEAVERGEVIAVVAWDLDRLTRQPRELEDFLALADRVGLRHLVTVADNVDPTTGDGLLVARIKAAVAAEEVAKTRKRLLRAKADKAERGEWNGGPAPYGRGPGMSIDAAEAEVLREAARRVLAGESFRGVALDLSDRGLGPRGKRWAGGSNLAQRLTAPHVAGLRAHHAQLSAATWKPILDRETWERLRALRADPSRRTRVGAPARMLLTGGVGRCGKCGAPLRARPTTNGRRRYGCPPEGDHGYGCGGVTRDAEVLDGYVTEAVLARLEKADLGALVAEDNIDVATLAAEYEAVNAKLAELAEAWATDAVTRAEWDAARAGLDARRRRVERELERARRSSTAAAIAGPTVREAWDALDLDGRRAIIRELLPGAVTVHPIGRGRWRTFDPATVTLGWFDS